jgi:lysophospholipase L1-like esterase
MMTQPMRFLALGDSYTIGTSVDYVVSWPYQLVYRLHSEGISVNVPQIVAKNGWTTDELTAGIADVDPQGPYDLVTLLIGVNNQFRSFSIETYRVEFRELLGQAICFTNGDPSKVIVFSIPDWSVTPFSESRDSAQIAAEIDQFNSVNLKETKNSGARYLNITSISRMFGDDPEFLAPDGLHPSGKMYSAWVELILPMAIEILSNR